MSLRTWMNGALRESSNTKQLIFDRVREAFGIRLR
jgi:hypothetical protein